MEYRIVILDDDKAEIYKTEQMLFACREMHPENKFEISCHTEVKTFMETMCTGADTAESQSYLYPDDSDVQIQAKEEKHRKSIKEFLMKLFHAD